MFVVTSDNKKIRAIPNFIPVNKAVLPKHYRIGWLLCPDGIEYILEENVKKSRGHFWVYRCSVYVKDKPYVSEIVSLLLEKSKHTNNNWVNKKI